MLMKSQRSILFIFTISAIMGYMLFISSEANVFVDLWVFETITLQAMTFLIILLLLSFLCFRCNALSACLFYSVACLSSLILTPIMKYPNSIMMYGAWDSLAHFSFSKWILENGYIPTNNELFYSSQYGFHPGNGLLPSFMSLATLLPIGLSVNFILIVCYATYVIIFYAILKILIMQPKSRGVYLWNNVTLYLLLVLVFSMMFFPPHYGGVEIAYPFVALAIYGFTKIYCLGQTQSGSKSPKNSLILLVAFTGLLLTHFSTATILTQFVILLLPFLFLVPYFRKRGIYGYAALLNFFVIYMAYELFVDIMPFSETLSGAFKRFITLYVSELESYFIALRNHPYMSFPDFLRYIFANYTKLVVLFLFAFIQLFVTLFSFIRLKNKNQIPSYRAYLFLFQSVALISWFIGWFGVGNFFSGGRCIMLLQIFVSLNLTDLLLDSLHKNRCLNIKFSSSKHFIEFLLVGVAVVSIIIFGLIANFGLYNLNPSLVYSGESYKLTGNGVVNDFPIRAMCFLNNYSSPNVTFVSIQPYVTFGYSDLLWNVNKVPRHGYVFAGDFPDDVTEKVNSILQSRTKTIVPLPTRDDIIAGKLGLKSYYLEPFRRVNAITSLVYNNEYYVLSYRD